LFTLAKHTILVKIILMKLYRLLIITEMAATMFESVWSGKDCIGPPNAMIIFERKFDNYNSYTETLEKFVPFKESWPSSNWIGYREIPVSPSFNNVIPPVSSERWCANYLSRGEPNIFQSTAYHDLPQN
jgi:hypothetical protein